MYDSRFQCEGNYRSQLRREWLNKDSLLLCTYIISWCPDLSAMMQNKQTFSLIYRRGKYTVVWPPKIGISSEFGLLIKYCKNTEKKPKQNCWGGKQESTLYTFPARVSNCNEQLRMNFWREMTACNPSHRSDALSRDCLISCSV